MEQTPMTIEKKLDAKILAFEQHLEDIAEQLDDHQKEGERLRYEQLRCSDALAVLKEIRGDDIDGDADTGRPCVDPSEETTDEGKTDPPPADPDPKPVDPPKERKKKAPKAAPKKKTPKKKPAAKPKSKPKPDPKPKKPANPKTPNGRLPALEAGRELARKKKNQIDDESSKSIQELTIDVLRSRPGQFMTLAGISMQLCGDSENKGLTDHLSGILKKANEEETIPGLERQKDGRRVLYRVVV